MTYMCIILILILSVFVFGYYLVFPGLKESNKKEVDYFILASSSSNNGDFCSGGGRRGHTKSCE